MEEENRSDEDNQDDWKLKKKCTGAQNDDVTTKASNKNNNYSFSVIKVDWKSQHNITDTESLKYKYTQPESLSLFL